MAYDEVLKLEGPRRLAYADDRAVMVMVRTGSTPQERADETLDRVVQCIVRSHLKLAQDEAEVLHLIGRE